MVIQNSVKMVQMSFFSAQKKTFLERGPLWYCKGDGKVTLQDPSWCWTMCPLMNMLMSWKGIVKVKYHTHLQNHDYLSNIKDPSRSNFAVSETCSILFMNRLPLFSSMLFVLILWGILT